MLATLAQTAQDVITNAPAWQDTLSKIGPLGLVTIFALFLLRENIRSKEEMRKEHQQRIDAYHTQEMARADKLMLALENNTKAITEFTGTLGRLSMDVSKVAECDRKD